MSDAIEKEITINAPIARVWDVITNPEHIAVWLGAKAEFELRPGARGKFIWEKFGEAPLTIVGVDEPRLFSYRWVSADAETRSINGETLVAFELSELGDSTILRLTESGFDSLAIDQKDKDTLRNKHAGGWGTFATNIQQYAINL